MTVNRHPNDSRFENAWDAYVNEDARLRAPAGLEARVWAALASQPTRKRSHPVRWLAVAASFAALAVVGSLTLRDQGGRPEIPSARVGAHSVASTPAVVSSAHEERSHEVTPVTRRRPVVQETLPPVLMSLGANPVRDTEVLQLVRLRLPREALQTLGVVLLEPEAAGIVDVDVLIGEDGVARDIRYVRAGQEQETVPW